MDLLGSSSPSSFGLYERRMSATEEGRPPLSLDAHALVPSSSLVPSHLPNNGGARTPQAQRELNFMRQCQQHQEAFAGGAYHRTSEDFGLTHQERQWLTELYHQYREDATNMDSLLLLLRTIENANTDQEQLLQALSEQFDLHVMNGVPPVLQLEQLYAYSARVKERTIPQGTERDQVTMEAFTLLGGNADGSGFVEAQYVRDLVKRHQLPVDVNIFLHMFEVLGDGPIGYAEFSWLYNEGLRSGGGGLALGNSMQISGGGSRHSDSSSTDFQHEFAYSMGEGTSTGAAAAALEGSLPYDVHQVQRRSLVEALSTFHRGASQSLRMTEGGGAGSLWDGGVTPTSTRKRAIGRVKPGTVKCTGLRHPFEVLGKLSDVLSTHESRMVYVAQSHRKNVRTTDIREPYRPMAAAAAAEYHQGHRASRALSISTMYAASPSPRTPHHHRASTMMAGERTPTPTPLLASRGMHEGFGVAVTDGTTRRDSPPSPVPLSRPQRPASARPAPPARPAPDPKEPEAAAATTVAKAVIPKPPPPPAATTTQRRPHTSRPTRPTATSTALVPVKKPPQSQSRPIASTTEPPLTPRLKKMSGECDAAAASCETQQKAVERAVARMKQEMEKLMQLQQARKDLVQHLRVEMKAERNRRQYSPSRSTRRDQESEGDRDAAAQAASLDASHRSSSSSSSSGHPPSTDKRKDDEPGSLSPPPPQRTTTNVRKTQSQTTFATQSTSSSTRNDSDEGDEEDIYDNDSFFVEDAPQEEEESETKEKEKEEAEEGKAASSEAIHEPPPVPLAESEAAESGGPSREQLDEPAKEDASPASKRSISSSSSRSSASSSSSSASSSSFTWSSTSRSSAASSTHHSRRHASSSKVTRSVTNVPISTHSEEDDKSPKDPQQQHTSAPNKPANPRSDSGGAARSRPSTAGSRTETPVVKSKPSMLRQPLRKAPPTPSPTPAAQTTMFGVYVPQRSARNLKSEKTKKAPPSAHLLRQLASRYGATKGGKGQESPRTAAAAAPERASGSRERSPHREAATNEEGKDAALTPQMERWISS